MAFKSISKELTTSDADIVECPATSEGACVLGIANKSGGAQTYTLKHYIQALGTTLTIAAGVSVPANSSVKFPAPISMLAGDRLIMAASANSALVAMGTFTYSASAPAATGFAPKTAWSSVANYVTNDVVSRNGNSYVASQASLNQDPATQAAYWVMLAAKGDTGAGDLTAANNLADLASKPTALVNLAAKGQGKQTIPIPAIGMKSRTTNGPASGSVEMTTNKNMVLSLDFDATTQEFAQFWVPMPKSWNLGTVTFQPIWSHPATTVNFGVVWALQGVAISDAEALDVAFGTEQTSTDVGGTTNTQYTGPESAAITIAGTPAAGDIVQFQIKRVPADGSDTLAVDARLHGIRLYYTDNAVSDA